jgi:hypothetical protein
MSRNESEAIKFYTEKILLQAQKENVPLSKAEKEALEWKWDYVEEEDEPAPKPAKMPGLASDFEKKLVMLVRNKYCYRRTYRFDDYYLGTL